MCSIKEANREVRCGSYKSAEKVKSKAKATNEAKASNEAEATNEAKGNNEAEVKRAKSKLKQRLNETRDPWRR